MDIIIWILGALIVLYILRTLYAEFFGSSSAPDRYVSEEEIEEIYEASGAYEVLYEDRFGERTKRVINVHRIEKWVGHRYAVIAYCELRKEPRAFRVDRIAQMTDMDTGEVFSGKDEVLQHFGVYP